MRKLIYIVLIFIIILLFTMFLPSKENCASTEGNPVVSTNKEIIAYKVSCRKVKKAGWVQMFNPFNSIRISKFTNSWIIEENNKIIDVDNVGLNTLLIFDDSYIFGQTTYPENHYVVYKLEGVNLVKKADLGGTFGERYINFWPIRMTRYIIEKIK